MADMAVTIKYKFKCDFYNIFVESTCTQQSQIFYIFCGSVLPLVLFGIFLCSRAW